MDVSKEEERIKKLQRRKMNEKFVFASGFQRRRRKKKGRKKKKIKKKK